MTSYSWRYANPTDLTYMKAIYHNGSLTVTPMVAHTEPEDGITLVQARMQTVQQARCFLQVLGATDMDLTISEEQQP